MKTILEPMPFPSSILERLDELQKLQQGWLDGKHGEVLNPDLIPNVIEVLMTFIEADIPLPAIYPLIVGGIQLEWNNKDFGDIGWGVDIQWFNEGHVEFDATCLSSFTNIEMSFSWKEDLGLGDLIIIELKKIRE